MIGCASGVSNRSWLSPRHANRFKVAKVLGLWSAFTPEEHEERVRQVSNALLSTPPPHGWRPLGPDDELLLTLLPDETA